MNNRGHTSIEMIKILKLLEVSIGNKLNFAHTL